ncbi:MAG: LmbE family protein [Streptosporangiaceae bacterium]|jgi:LmbE family N-acetylglucosaminyl deacetylase|nr:LmbE family protein [Streptosporangiaceae bacterium]
MSGRPVPDRRQVLAAGVLGLAAAGTGLAACSSGAKITANDPGDPDPRLTAPPAVGMTGPGPTPRAPVADRTTVLHVVAHPDDDLFFLNPEIQQSIAAGHRVIGICVTAAESSGRNGPSRHISVRDYAKARQNGLRAAYGQMVLGNRGAAWSRSTLPLPNGSLAEVDTLGEVTLIFLNVRKTPADGRLRNLWSGRLGALPTLVPTGGAVGGRYRYRRTELIDALVHLLDLYRPTLVRTMDLDPDRQVHNSRHSRHTDHGDFSDHEDHTATAQFTWAALARYAGPGGGRHWAVESYRGYYNCRWPFDLSDAAWRVKESLLNIYAGAAPADCGDPAGCADLSMRERVAAAGWGQSTHHRYVSTTPWLLPGGSGALTAFAVLDQQAAMWTETAPGSGQWSGPVLLGGGPLVPRLSASLSPDGRWQLLGERVGELGPNQHDRRRTVVLLEQRTRDGGFGPWTDLGTPESGAGMRNLGVPVAARRPDGRLQLFARTSHKGLGTRAQRADGSWTPWRDLGGGPVQEGVTVLTTSDGRIELYGCGRLSLVRWYQRRPGGPFLLDTGLRLPVPGTPPAVLELADGGLLVVYRLAGSGEVAGFRRPRGGGAWDQVPMHLGGQGGIGPMQVLALPTPLGSGQRLLLVQQNDAGTVSTAPCPASVQAPPLWTSSGPWFAHSPAAAVDARGRAVLAVIGPDARLHTTALPASGPLRRGAAGPAAWTAV